MTEKKKIVPPKVTLASLDAKIDAIVKDWGLEFSKLEHEIRTLSFYRMDVSKIQQEVIQMNQRFKPVIFLPKELEGIPREIHTTAPSIARNDQPYTPSIDNPYTPPKGFPIGWTPPKGMKRGIGGAIAAPAVTDDVRPDQSWKPPGWKDPLKQARKKINKLEKKFNPAL